MNPIMNAVKEKEHEDAEITHLILLGMERENEERQALEKKYTQEYIEQARSEDYTQGFKSGYAEAKAMRALYGEGE